MKKTFYILILSSIFNLILSSIATAQPAGSSISNPIIAGTLTSCGFFLSNKNNAPANGFGNNYGQPSDDIWYKFITTETTTIDMESCNSDFDTYMYLLNSSGTLLYSNDDNGVLCSGAKASLSVSIPAGTYYVVAEGYGSAFGNLALVISYHNRFDVPYEGTTFSNPINLGLLNRYAPFISDTKNNLCYGNDYGQPSEDIFYKFQIAEAAQVTVSTCGSGIDTYLSLLNSAGTLLASNDDTYSSCPENNHGFSAITMTLPPGDYYVVSEGYSNYSGSITTNVSLSYGDEYKNWIIARTFDENGDLISESKSFYDLLGQKSQTQIRNISAGQVLANDQANDALGRTAISSLTAPINNSQFLYKENFLSNANVNGKYNYSNFDLAKTNTPDTLSSVSQGTLGWYYSNNNTIEPYQPKTGYPYVRQTFYSDGTGSAKNTSDIGEYLRTGSGKESSLNRTPLVNELSHYTQVRNKFFTAAQLGAMPTSINNNNESSSAVLNVGKDANGQRNVVIQNNIGDLMTARPDAAGILTITDTITVKASGTTYQHIFSTSPINPGPYRFEIISADPVQVYKNGALEYSGTGSNYTFSIPWGTAAAFDIRSSFPFTVVYNGYEEHFITLDVSDYSQHYFNLLQPAVISVTGSYTLYDMATESVVSGSGTLPSGFYRLRANSGTVVLRYSYKLTDISYNFFNQLGQLVASIAPEGVKALLTNGLSAYPNLSSVPFVNTFAYDVQGRVIGSNTTDGGSTEFIYRTDGNVRFSQNAEQRKTGRFSYINFDRWARPIERGEYLPGTITFTAAKTNIGLQESAAADGGLTGGTKQFQVKTNYDIVDSSHGLAGRVQDAFYLKSGVSFTENSNSKTWYNYDAQGRISWIIKSIAGLGTKTIDYTYLPNGNLETVDFQKNIPTERFVHHYEYDTDTRLKTMYTSLNGTTKTLQAKYYYYLHGPLKRIELGTNLQGIDYTYTPQGWLKTINHPNANTDPGKDGPLNSFAPDVFSLTKEYFNGDYSRKNTGIGSIITSTTRQLFTGDVSGQSFKSLKPATVVAAYGSAVNNPAMFTYEYKDNYFFDQSKYGSPNFTSNTFTASVNGANREFGLSYDAHGNIKTLSRSNNAGTNTALTYSYIPATNKLQGVTNYATYTYDDLGQMLSQFRTGGQGYYLSYDVNGQVIAIYSDAAKTLLRVSYAYDEFGQRVRKTDHILNIVTYYVYNGADLVAIYDNNGTILQQKEIPIYAADRIGTYKKVPGNFQYELNDDLGNVRAVVNQAKIAGAADVVYYSDYYPFGSTMTLANSDYRYGFQGKFAEADKETGWNNFDLRMYDPGIGRWMRRDPQRQFISPYIGMNNDPINNLDPDGGYTLWRGLRAWIFGGFKGSFGHETSGDRKGEYYIGNMVVTGTDGGRTIDLKQVRDYGNGDFGGKVYPNGTISAKQSDLLDKWGESSNFFAQYTYGMLDPFVVYGTSLVTQPNHLSGNPATRRDLQDAGISLASTALGNVIGETKLAYTVFDVKQLNAIKFNAKFRKYGITARTMGGAVVRRYNQGIRKIQSVTALDLTDWINQGADFTISNEK